MNKLCVLLIFALLASSTLFAIPVIPSMQAQGPTSDLPMTIINETNSSNNTVKDVIDTHNMSQVFSR
ncbi:MAG: hypothetical protein L0H53_16875 [Candidatus Nitrosocosmicus sp.]|nr:hypothetical protein [Candidatus Nitrosocosmicus sp.]MDN5868663.1 hypothetical protein [Candidatus Nitrosocosmicus sp.]